MQLPVEAKPIFAAPDDDGFGAAAAAVPAAAAAAVAAAASPASGLEIMAYPRFGVEGSLGIFGMRRRTGGVSPRDDGRGDELAQFELD